MNPQEFQFIAQLLKERSGLSLAIDKEYLLESRLRSVARAHDFTDLSGLIQHVQKTPGASALITEIVEAMTTNESMFFRDNKPFESLKEKIIPAMQPHLSGGLSVWSAACSNGQEPYSLAMLFEEHKATLGLPSYKILGTDIDTQVLEKAKEGIYTQFEVQRGLPIQLLIKYFDQQAGNEYQIKDMLKRSITFRFFNLLESYASLGSFDMIMCRNVLIYFDEATKRDILERLCRCLKPHGVLLLGSAETVIGITDKLKPVVSAPGIFVKAETSTVLF